MDKKAKWNKLYTVINTQNTNKISVNHSRYPIVTVNKT